MKELAVWLVATAIASWLLGHVAWTVLRRRGVLDHPNERSSHTQPTVRGGGMAIIAAILLISVVGWRSHQSLGLFGLLGVGLVLAGISFIDDLKSLGPLIRFGCQAAIVLSALYFLRLPTFSISFSAESAWAAPAFIGAPILFLWLAGYTNAFNFMDGINGIAAGQAAMTGLGMSLLGAVVSGQWSVVSGQWSVVSPPMLLSLVIAGAALGFLPHNFPRARMFMGDVGSAPLGFLLAILALWIARDHGWFLLIPLALLHANFVLDTGITLARRILRGERWYEPHREHFYQRLIRSGKSHPFVTGLEMALQGMVLALMMLYLQASVPVRVGLIVLVFVVWLAFFAYCERLFRRNCGSR